MKRIIYFILFALLWTAFFTSCAKEPAEDQISKGRQEAISLLAKFEDEALLQSFSHVGNKIYNVVFSDGSSISVDGKNLSIFNCTADSWPIISMSDNTWSVGGVRTGAAYTADLSKEAAIAVIYDGSGLYIPTSSGRILFFHPGAAREIGCFKFAKGNNPQLSKDVVCLAGDDGIALKGIVSGSPDLTKLIPTIACRGTVTYNGAAVISNVSAFDFSKEVVFETTVSSGAAKRMPVSVSYLKRIPILKIATEGKATIVSKEDYLNASITLEDPDLLYGSAAATTLTTRIRGRGNSTWGMPKKPYRLKLDETTQMLGMSTDKDWALLANYSDKTLLRNFAVYEMSRILGMSWTPSMRPVELYLNDSYDGQYMFTEHVKVSSERVDIALAGKNDNDGEAITGGYFFEIDQRYGEVTHFTTAKGLPINFKDPEIPTDAQLAYVKQYFAAAENALYSSNFKDPVNGYAKYIDITSFARNYIIQELTKNVDGNMRLSSYLVKERGGKIAHSHVWDFDLTLGNCDYIPNDNPVGSPEGFLIKSAVWYERLMLDPAFVAVVKQEWNKLYGRLDEVEGRTRQMAMQIDESQKRNFQRWPILGYKVWPNVVALGTYNAELEYMLKFLNDRARWLDVQINAM